MYKPKYKIRLLVSCSILLISNLAHSNNSYLNEIEAEADIQLDNTTKKINTKKNSITKKKFKFIKDSFEARLSRELPATFRTYTMLSKDKKDKVIRAYINTDENMSVATRVLFNLYFNINLTTTPNR